jgi:transcriptional regulator with PAS, ATPase and Fis domain
VRELANLLEYLVITVDEEVILPEHLPDKYVCKKQHEDDAACPDKSLHAELRKHETVLIKKALSKSTSLEEAAHRLGISLATLVRRKRVIRSDGYL